MLTTAAFRAAFPEFGNVSAYPNAAIEARLAVAYMRLAEDVWADLRDHGAGLYVAHSLAVAGRNKVGADGKVMAGAAGAVSSKAVDKVSVSYDTSIGTVEGAGWFNLSTYGVEFWQLALMFGGGGFQL